jgi:pyridoxal phosphate enzyme (YggS family)
LTTIAVRLQDVRTRIDRAARACGRRASDITLLAVSKTFPASCIEEAHRAGQIAFGENYAQEAVTKITALAQLGLEWHFIGPIQSNKARLIAERFHWVHSIDREKVAARLSAARPPNLPPLNVCIQVNVSGEATKGGVEPGEDFLQAARREIEEEAGLSRLVLIAPLGALERLTHDKQKWVTTHFFLFTTDQLTGMPTDHVHHLQEPIWRRLDQLDDMFWPCQRQLVLSHAELIRQQF